MVAFGLHQTAIEGGEFWISVFEAFSQALEFLAASTFDEGAAEQVINRLSFATVANTAHESADPEARIGLSEIDTSLLEEGEHELEVLEFFDGDGVEGIDVRIEVSIFLQVD